MRVLDPVIDTWDRLQYWVGRRVPAPLQRGFERFRIGSRRVGRAVQTGVVTVLLFFVYLVGAGLTRLMARRFSRRFLTMNDLGPAAQSYWQDATGYEQDRDKLLTQF